MVISWSLWHPDICENRAILGVGMHTVCLLNHLGCHRVNKQSLKLSYNHNGSCKIYLDVGILEIKRRQTPNNGVRLPPPPDFSGKTSRGGAKIGS